MDNLFLYMVLKDLIGMFISLTALFATFMYFIYQVKKEEKEKEENKSGHRKM